MMYSRYKMISKNITREWLPQKYEKAKFELIDQLKEIQSLQSTGYQWE